MKRRITRYECVALIKTPLFTAALGVAAAVQRCQWHALLCQSALAPKIIKKERKKQNWKNWKIAILCLMTME